MTEKRGYRDAFASERLAQFREDGLRPLAPLYVLWLATALGLCFLVFSLRDTYLDAARLPLVLHVVIVVVHLFYRFKAGGIDNVLAPDVVFVGFYTLFHLGYMILFVIGLAEYDTAFVRYEAAIPKTFLVANVGLVGFLFGTAILGQRAGRTPQRRLAVPPSRRWAAVGVVLMIAGVAVHIIGIGTLGFANIRTYGYTAIQGASEYSGYTAGLLIGKSSQLFALGLVVYIVFSSLRHGKLFHSRAALALVIIYTAILLLEGDRSPIVNIYIPLLLCSHYVIRRFKIRYVVAVLFLVLMVFSAVLKMRSYAGDLDAMVSEYRYYKGRGVLTWMAPMLEMGRQFVVLNIVVHEVPAQHGYWYGDSWKAALTHTVPFLQGFAFERGWIREPPSSWLTREYFGSGSPGTGFLISAEGYLNFGYAGAFFECMAFGLLLRALVIWFCRLPSAPRALALFACLGPSIQVVRDHFNTVSSTYAIVLLVAWVLHQMGKHSGRTVHADDTKRPATRAPARPAG